MAVAVARLVREAVDQAGKAQALALRIQTFLGRSYNHRTVSAWGRSAAMPPADAAFAVAKAAGVSIDQYLGIGREPAELESQLAAVQDQRDQQRATTETLRVQVDRLAGLVAHHPSVQHTPTLAEPVNGLEERLIKLKQRLGALTEVVTRLQEAWGCNARYSKTSSKGSHRVRVIRSTPQRDALRQGEVQEAGEARAIRSWQQWAGSSFGHSARLAC